MKESKFVSGETVDEKFKSVENTLRKFSNRLGNVISFSMPPSILCTTIELKDGYGKYTWFIPCEGQIRGGQMIFYGPMIESGTVEMTKAKPGETGTTTTQALAKGTQGVQIPTVECAEGVLLTLSINVTFVQNLNEGVVPLVVIGAAFYAKAKAALQNPFDIEMLIGASK